MFIFESLILNVIIINSSLVSHVLIFSNSYFFNQNCFFFPLTLKVQEKNLLTQLVAVNKMSKDLQDAISVVR